MGEVTNNSTVTGLLAGLIIVLSLHLVTRFLSMGLEIFQKKNETTDRLAGDFRELNLRITAIERDMNEVLKFRREFRKLFAGIKALAGDRWNEVCKALEEEDIFKLGD